jgi:hypothetical protein
VTDFRHCSDKEQGRGDIQPTFLLFPDTGIDRVEVRALIGISRLLGRCCAGALKRYAATHGLKRWFIAGVVLSTSSVLKKVPNYCWVQI